MKKYLIISSILLFSLFLNCEKDGDEKGTSDCTFTYCTMEFRFIVVQVKKSSDSSAVVLSDYKVTRTSDGKDITISNNILDDNSGYYILANDSGREMFINKNVEIEFKGYINNSLVADRKFVVTANCCHISLVSGESVIYI